MASALWSFEIEFLAKVQEWIEKAPENEIYYVSRVEIHDTDGTVIGHFYTGDESRFERAEATE